MRWIVLWISFLLSVLISVGLVEGVVTMGRKEELGLMLPLLPLFNALLFPFLEKIIPSEEQRLNRRLEGRSATGWTGALDSVILGFLVGMIGNALMDLLAVFTYQRLPAVWGAQVQAFSMPSALDLLTGHADPFTGHWRLIFLLGELLIVSAMAGLCAGLLSKGEAILNGLLTGAFLSLWMAANQYVSVYETLSNISGRVLGRMFGARWEWNYGLLLVLFLQVLLCAIFSGWAFRLKARTASAKI